MGSVGSTSSRPLSVKNPSIALTNCLVGIEDESSMLDSGSESDELSSEEKDSSKQSLSMTDSCSRIPIKALLLRMIWISSFLKGFESFQSTTVSLEGRFSVSSEGHLLVDRVFLKMCMFCWMPLI